MPMTQPYLEGTKLHLLTVAMGLGTFIQVLDTSIANVAIPTIAGDLGVSTDNGTWVITSFAASNAIVLPLTGWLADYFGRVRLFVLSTILFAVTSFLCGLAPNFTTLVMFRILQGAVAGTLIPLSQSLILINNPPEKRGTALGVWAMVVIVAPVLGPILGGWITDDYGWSWIFYINVPIGLLSSFMAWQILKDRESEIVRYPIDYVGLVLLTVGVGCLQVLLDKGNDLDWLNSNFICTLGVISVISISYFIAWESGVEYPVVNLKFFKDRSFLFATISASVGYMLFFGSTVIIPLWVQAVKAYNPTWAGIVVAPIGIIPVIISPFVGKYTPFVDARWVATFSFVVFALTNFWSTNFTSDVGPAQIMAPRFWQGLGIATFFVPLVQISVSNISSKDLTSASGVFNFMRILIGSGFGTSIFVTYFSRFGIFHHERVGESVNLFRPVVRNYYQQVEVLLNLHGQKASAFVDQVVQEQTVLMATLDLFWVSGWVFLLCIPFIWLCKKSKGVKMSSAGAH
jgi:MFS transporter, DHA2 family, multidrug resistance protein